MTTDTKPVQENPAYRDTSPIAALATPLAESALALIRTSGGGCSVNAESSAASSIELLASIFSRPEKLRAALPNSIIHGWMHEPDHPEKKIDEVLLSVYRAPHSYTGEDGVDISCHGGIATVKAILAVLKKAGFRDALGGEFTFRAFMNGKLDLTRAESVMELVAAKTDKGREQALRRLSGSLQREVSEIKDLLVEVLAGTEIYLDYSEDEFFGNEDDRSAGSPSDEEAGRLPMHSLAREAEQRMKVLAAQWQRQLLYTEGILAVIAGRPNAGKSSLFNFLIREDRSIVTDIPGTTRDWIEASLSIDGIPIRLADTAGLRDSETSDEVERIGIQRSRDLVAHAGIVLYIINGAEGITREDTEFIAAHTKAAAGKPILVLWNKADIVPPSDHHAIPDVQLLPVSAHTGLGIDLLTRAIAELLQTNNSGSYNEDAIGPGTLRQKELIDTALSFVTEALSLAKQNEPLDIIAPLFRSAIYTLAEITGEVSASDIFDTMFSRFCVGK